MAVNSTSSTSVIVGQVRTKKSLTPILGSLLIWCASIAAQETHPSFEVVSIKPSAPDAKGMTTRMSPGGSIDAVNITLKSLIEWAWRVQPFQISGGPDWMDSLRYDISAKPETKPKLSDLPFMLQAIVRDRFQLRLRTETKELPVYALVLAKKAGKLGPRLIAAKDGSCAKLDPTNSTPRQAGTASLPSCGSIGMSNKNLTAKSIMIPNLTPMLSRQLGRRVIDKTGLSGLFDVRLDWTPDEMRPVPAEAPADSASGSIFTAFQEQLGLKLEAQKGPVEVLVIEHVEKPSEN